MQLIAEAMRCMIRDYAQHLIGKESDMIRQHLQLANMINAPSGPNGLPTCAYAGH